jgi:hypothetical protein
MKALVLDDVTLTADPSSAIMSTDSIGLEYYRESGHQDTTMLEDPARRARVKS